MTTGLSSANFSDKILNHMLRAVASTAPAANYVRPHIGDPGAAGTTNVPAAEHSTPRSAATFNAAAGASGCTLSNTPTWTSWAGTNGAVISHISIWDAASAGTFLYSAALSASKTVATGDTLTLTSLTVTLAPIAA